MFEPTHVEQHLVPPLLGKLLALLVKIRLELNDLPMTNTLAYYEYSYITAVKFNNIGPVL